MKKVHFIFAGLFIIISQTFSQNSKTEEGRKVKFGIVFIELDTSSNQLTYFTDAKHPDSRKVLNPMTFSLVDDNSCNLLIKWLNPLKYKFTWKDTTFIDERDKIVSDFVKQLTAQFGLGQVSDKKSKDFAATNDYFICQKDSSLWIPGNGNGFNDRSLNQVLLQILSVKDALTKVEIYNINKLNKELTELDELNSIPVAEKVNNIFTEYFNINSPTDVNTIIEIQNAEIEKFNDIFKTTEDLQKNIPGQIISLNLTLKVLERYIKIPLLDFIYQTEINLKSNRELTKKLESIIIIVKKSILNESREMPGYFLMKNIAFGNGEKLESLIQLTEFKMKDNKSDIKDLVKKSELVKLNLVFQKYDPITVWVSTGVFYTNITEKEFGVSNGADNNLTITEENIKKNRYGAAAYLNFKYNWGSRYLAPLLQIGIDPTKKKPFLLLGGGFVIPSSQFSITGGPVWTWNASLGSLKVGDTVNSTTDIEKDIKYEFDSKPKGWYLGIQYNF